MDAVDSSMTVMEDVDAAVNMDTGASGTEEPVNASLDNASGIETVKDEDATGGRVIRKCTNPTGVTAADRVDNVRDDVQSADTICTEDSSDSADLTDSRSMQINELVDSMDQSAKDDSNESDGDSTSESTCLEAMTPYGQDHYLRLGDTPRRRSALRLSRIIARQQLLRRLAQGRNRESWLFGISVIVGISVRLDSWLISQCR